MVNIKSQKSIPQREKTDALPFVRSAGVRVVMIGLRGEVVFAWSSMLRQRRGEDEPCLGWGSPENSSAEAMDNPGAGGRNGRPAPGQISGREKTTPVGQSNGSPTVSTLNSGSSTLKTTQK